MLVVNQYHFFIRALLFRLMILEVWLDPVVSFISPKMHLSLLFLYYGVFLAHKNFHRLDFHALSQQLSFTLRPLRYLSAFNLHIAQLIVRSWIETFIVIITLQRAWRGFLLHWAFPLNRLSIAINFAYLSLDERLRAVNLWARTLLALTLQTWAWWVFQSLGLRSKRVQGVCLTIICSSLVVCAAWDLSDYILQHSAVIIVFWSLTGTDMPALIVKDLLSRALQISQIYVWTCIWVTEHLLVLTRQSVQWYLNLFIFLLHLAVGLDFFGEMGRFDLMRSKISMIFVVLGVLYELRRILDSKLR